jgi:hypothetical protein
MSEGTGVRRESLLSRVPLAIATIAAMGVIIWLDRSPSDVASQMTMGAILLGSAALGAMAPRRPWVPGLLLGSVVAVVGVVEWTAGVPEPPTVHLPPGLLGPASLLVLVVPALVAAYLGAGLRVWRSRPQAADRGNGAHRPTG